MQKATFLFQCRLTTSASFSAYKGSMLRGSLGTFLKKTCCTVRRNSCDDCMLARHCAFPLLFIGKVTEGGGQPATLPPPYCLEPCDTGKTAYDAGERFSFSLTLFSYAVGYLPYFVHAFFELCLETVFSLAREHTAELLFSIAGGRKTMSAALALAAQCYARPQDSMFHVLVPPEQEVDPQFLYPRLPQDGRVTLTPVPFFRMREQLPPELLHSPASLEALSHVCMAQKPLRVELDFSTRSLTCEGRTLVLPPALFAVYAFFAMEKAPCPKGAEFCPSTCRSCSLAWSDIEPRLAELAALYQQVETKVLARGEGGILRLSAENFRSSLAKLKKLLTQCFGEATGTRLSIVSERRNGSAAYALRIPRTLIRVVSQRCVR